MIEVSDECINLVSNFKMQNVKAHVIEDNKYITPKEMSYKFSSSLFKAVMKTFAFTTENENVHNKNLNIQYGLLVGEVFEYSDLGTFFVKDLEDKKKSEKLSFTAYDKMLNFMVDFRFEKLGISLPCTMLEFSKALADYCGVELYSEIFFNSDLIVDEDFFTNQDMTCRDVLDKIAEATLSIIFIKEDKLYIKHLDKTNVVIKLTPHDIENLEVYEKFGPLNSLILGRGDVGDDVGEQDAESIKTNGLQEIRIDENEFLDGNRKHLAKLMLNKIKGLEFYGYKSKDLGFLFFEPGDFVIQSDSTGNEYLTVVLNLAAKITTGVSSETYADIPKSVTTTYKAKTKEEKKTLKVERIAKKNKGIIQDLIEEQSEHESKLTKVEQDIDSIKQTASNTAEYKRHTEGITEVHLEDAGQAEVLKLEVQGNKTYESNLFPGPDLYPGATLYPNARR